MMCLFVYRSDAVMDGRRDDVLVCRDLGAYKHPFITSYGTCCAKPGRKHH